MGDYGHSHLHEFSPGSTTGQLVRRSPIPLLTAHENADALPVAAASRRGHVVGKIFLAVHGA
jgi:hypothetical protein